MTDLSKNFDRPLSPHLQVYKLPMTALMSISHRATGVILSGGCILIAVFLITAMLGPDHYNRLVAYARTDYGFWFMLAWAAALYYHLCNGVRHLIWDTVHLLEFGQAKAAGWVVLLATAILTAGTWYLATQI